MTYDLDCIGLGVKLYSPTLIVYVAKTVVQAFTLSRLDYCNMLYGLTDIQLRRLQLASLLVTGTRRRERILLCLETSTGCKHDDALLVYKSLHGLSLTNLSQGCRLVSRFNVVFVQPKRAVA